MGDEWGAREPFPFFCDFKGYLADAVRNGRRKEFAEAYARYGDEVPDPLSPETLRVATLDWSAIDKAEHRARLDLVRRLTATRKSHIVPRLPQLRAGHGTVELSEEVLQARWRFTTGESLSIVANLSDRIRPRPGDPEISEPIWGAAPSRDLQPWAVHVSIGGV
jgi:maltooligosyltrehalose trehalohydrolase